MILLVTGAAIGLALGVGLVLTFSRPPRAAIARRVMPHVRTTGFDWARPGATSHVSTARPVARLLDFMTSDRSVRERLERSASPLSVEGFRLEQLRWAVAGLLGAVGFGLFKAATGHPIPATAWVVLCCLAALGAVMARDYRLTRAVRAHSQRITAELPIFAELLAFTVAAGLAPSAAIVRVCHKLDGALSTELAACGDAVARGQSFVDALSQLSDRLQVPDLQRFVDGIVVAIQRGTPIAEVLRAQAMDARAAAHRELMEEASRREVFALFPVVFLVLPVVVIVAVYPGVVNLVV